MDEASRGAAVDPELQREVARILARREQELLAAVTARDSSVVDLLVRDVLRALEADTADQDAVYDAYHANPLPPADRVASAIRAHVRALAAGEGAA
jgi:hypothetical protein